MQLLAADTEEEKVEPSIGIFFTGTAESELMIFAALKPRIPPVQLRAEADTFCGTIKNVPDAISVIINSVASVPAKGLLFID